MFNWTIKYKVSHIISYDSIVFINSFKVFIRRIEGVDKIIKLARAFQH